MNSMKLVHKSRKSWLFLYMTDISISQNIRYKYRLKQEYLISVGNITDMPSLFTNMPLNWTHGIT